MTHAPLPLLVLWEQVVGELLDCTMRFPKVVRFTFSTRIDNLALDILERMVEARFARGAQRQALLAEADARLARLQTLLRLAHDRRYLAAGTFEALVRRLDEAGRMLGGWRRHVGGAPGGPDSGTKSDPQ